MSPILRVFVILSLGVGIISCIRPEASIHADLDPRFHTEQFKNKKLFIAFKDDSVEEKKFSFYLTQDLEKNGFTITASDDLADFQLIYALNLETFKTKEYMLLSNPDFVTSTINGRGFTAQRNAYTYAPVERAHVLKQIYIDLYQKQGGKPGKIWSGMLQMDNEDYRSHIQEVVQVLADSVGKDFEEKVRLKN